MNDEPLEPLEPLDGAPDPRSDARADAFSAAPFHWKDLQLAPLAIGREAAWLSHCRRIGLPRLGAVINDADSFLAHAIRMLWFCAHEPSAWLSIWIKGGDLGAFLLDIKITQWADAQIQPGDEAAAALKLALDIHDRSRINQASLLDSDDSDTEGNGSGPAHERNTSASSAGPAPEPTVENTLTTTSLRSKAGPMSTRTARARAANTSGRKKAPKKKRNSARG